MNKFLMRRSFLACWLLLAVSCVFAAAPARSQAVVDKWVATVNGSELITRSDLLWQLVLQPNTPIEPPRTEDLNRALQLVIDQRLIAQEAEKLPSITPKDVETEAELAELVKLFPSSTEFYERVRRVGLSSERLREIARERVAIKKFLDFRFRSFTVVTEQEVADYYRDVYVPRLRARASGIVVPTLEQARKEVQQTLTESKIASDTDAFLEDARARAEIVILNAV
ncbi:MAG: hypothetical protein H0V27_04610 [Pyrinomonadaceae bacterium]|nr:hypothetical protein [Pyrinomonadaceae bacterium]